MHHPQVTVLCDNAATPKVATSEWWIIEGDLPDNVRRVGAVTRKAARIATVAT